MRSLFVGRRAATGEKPFKTDEALFVLMPELYRREPLNATQQSC